MEKIDILLWAISGGFGGTWLILLYMMREHKSLREEVRDIDRRLCRIEGALSAKDCCMLKDDKLKKKAQ